MITSHGDRTKALRRMMEALGGSLEPAAIAQPGVRPDLASKAPPP
jgi:hypothetical protein